MQRNGQMGHLLEVLPDYIQVEDVVNKNRVRELNQNEIKKGIIVYLIEREIRLEDNFALNFALQKSKELNFPLKVIHPKQTYEVKAKNNFIEKEISRVAKDYKNANIDFEFFNDNDEKLNKYIDSLGTSILVIDFDPIREKEYTSDNYKIYEIDGHNIIPAHFASEKQEYNAFTFRRKVQAKLGGFLTEFPKFKTLESNAHKALEDFITVEMQYYSEFRNNPNKNVTSHMSKYTNLGFISPQRIALEVIKSDNTKIDKEEFLEELIVRKELADNFCLYNKNYKSTKAFPDWALKTLDAHKEDIRIYLYSKTEFEEGSTHDELWNASQKQLLQEGAIHGYLRMYWAKKILEWTPSANDALDIAIYLNDKYAYDAPSASGYVGILWSIGGLHDRAFGQRLATGKIRSMTYNGAKSKFDVKAYIKKYS